MPTNTDRIRDLEKNDAVQDSRLDTHDQRLDRIENDDANNRRAMIATAVCLLGIFASSAIGIVLILNATGS